MKIELLYIIIPILILFLFFYLFKRKQQEVESNESLNKISDIEPRYSTVKNSRSNSSKRRSILGNKEINVSPIDIPSSIKWVQAEDYQSMNILDVKSNSYSELSIKLKILVVDDSMVLRKYLSEFLIENEYSVELACNGEEAINKIIEDKVVPDLIITDMEMPIMDGVAFVDKIRTEKKYKNIPILVISAHAERHMRLMEEGKIQGFLLKPFQKSAMLEQIEYLSSY